MASLKTLRRPSPVTRHAVHLMVSTGGTAVLGIAFWALATRLFDAADVGQDAAALSAMTLIAQIAQLNLANAYLRLLPQAGRRTPSAILLGYGASAVLGACMAVAFLATPWRTDVIPAGLGASVVFVVAVLFWTIFVIQDGVLTALRQSVWVPVENLLFSACKLALLPVFAVVVSTQGVFLAWTTPVVVAVLAVNALLFLRVVPSRAAAPRPSAGHGAELPRRGALVSFITAEYLAGAVSAAATFLPPIIVFDRLGSTASARFYLPWVVGLAFYNLLLNIAASFIVEVSHEDEPFRILFRNSMRLFIGITAVGLVLTLAAGPLILGVLSSGYADAGTPLLRWIGLSFPFSAVTVLFSSSLWIRRHYWTLVGYQLGQTLVLIGLTYVLLDGLGIDAAGVAHLVAVGGAAVLSVPALVRWYRHRLAESEHDATPMIGTSPVTI